MAPTKQKPACRQAVRAAVIKAAAELFSAHGVEAVSMRAIAARANVNYGLIHRHFGAKENLLREVHSTLLERLKSVVVSASFDQAWFTEAFRTIQNHEQLWRLEALIGLGGKHEGRIQYGFPLMEDMVAAAEKAQAQGRLRNDVDPKVLVAAPGGHGHGPVGVRRHDFAGHRPGRKTGAPGHCRNPGQLWRLYLGVSPGYRFSLISDLLPGFADALMLFGFRVRVNML